MQRPGIISGGVAGFILTAPLLAMFYAGDQLMGLPFVPFDLFDWLAQVLPGGIVTQAIDAIVGIIRAFDLGETSRTAQTIEHLLAFLFMLAAGVIVGVVIFRTLNANDSRDAYPLGLAVGVVTGVLMAFISAEANITAQTGPVVSGVWILGIFVVWGLSFSWIYTDLVAIGVDAQVKAEQLAERHGASAVNREAVEIRAAQIDRREFLVRVGSATATLTVLGSMTGLALGTNNTPISVLRLDTGSGDNNTDRLPPDLPNADAAIQPAPGTRLEYTPLEDHYVIDIASRPPVIDEKEWTLNISGMVERPLNINLATLRDNYTPRHHYITLSCISNDIAGDLISTTKWTGVPFRELIADWGVSEDATHVHIRSADGFDEYMDLASAREDERIMLCYAWDDQPLPRRHGFPLRIYIPDRYGMKQPKWITDIEFINYTDEGYWVRRGWSEAALVNTTSVIDTVAVENAVERDGQIVIPIGGIAYAGARGISKVEVQVGETGWQEAELREPLSDLTWVVWRFEWPFQEGRFRFAVRCYDGDGVKQVESRRGVRPDGATGVHSVGRSIITPEV